MYKSLQKQLKALEEKDRAREEQHKELEKEIEKMKTQNTSELEGINNKLSNYAQHAIESSKGPLKPPELLKFLTIDISDKRSKESLPLIRKYSNDIDGVKKQLSQVFETLQNHMAYRKKQKELDDKFVKTLKKLEKSIDKEEEKEKKSGTKMKVQGTLDQYFGWGNVSCKIEVNYNKDQNSSAEAVEQTDTSKQEMPVKEGKTNRKRKFRTDDDSSSSQGSGVKNITSRFSKRLKINSSRTTTESSNSTESMSVEELDDHPQPMSVASSESSQSSSQPMSISESSQSDAMSVDDSRESMKTAKKVAGKNPKQVEQNAAMCNGEVETVHERRFYLRGNPL